MAPSRQPAFFASLSASDPASRKRLVAIHLYYWLSTRYALDYLGIFERMNNPNFNVTEFGNIRAESGSNGFVLTVKQWVERTNAIGIISTPGRYGGTYGSLAKPCVNRNN